MGLLLFLGPQPGSQLSGPVEPGGGGTGGPDTLAFDFGINTQVGVKLPLA